MEDKYDISGPNDNGYFFHLANSRSGHNFLRLNILSWKSNPDLWNYVNLENFEVSEFEKLNIPLDISGYPNIHVLSVRSLLNWYSSFFKLFFGKSDRVHINPDSIKFKTILWQSEFEDKFKMDKRILANPKIYVVEDGTDKEEFRRQKMDINNRVTVGMGRPLGKWLSLAKELKGVTNDLPQFTKIYYDDFFQKREYREYICEQIGGVYNEKELNTVTKGGHYSSFDIDRFQNKAQEMDVLTRWKQWSPIHRPYLKLVRDHEAMNFYLDNFEVSDEERKFIDNI